MQPLTLTLPISAIFSAGPVHRGEADVLLESFAEVFPESVVPDLVFVPAPFMTVPDPSAAMSGRFAQGETEGDMAPLVLPQTAATKPWPDPVPFLQSDDETGEPRIPVNVPIAPSGFIETALLDRPLGKGLLPPSPVKAAAELVGQQGELNFVHLPATDSVNLLSDGMTVLPSKDRAPPQIEGLDLHRVVQTALRDHIPPAGHGSVALPASFPIPLTGGVRPVSAVLQAERAKDQPQLPNTDVVDQAVAIRGEVANTRNLFKSAVLLPEVQPGSPAHTLRSDAFATAHVQVWQGLFLPIQSLEGEIGKDQPPHGHLLSVEDGASGALPLSGLDRTERPKGEAGAVAVSVPVADVIAARVTEAVADLLPAALPDPVPGAQLIASSPTAPNSVGGHAFPSFPQLAAQVAATLVARPEGEIEIAISPEELGHLRLRLLPDAQDPDRVMVTLLFERPDTLDLFRRHADQLAEALRAAGYAAADLSFGHAGMGGQGPDHPDSAANHPDRSAADSPAAEHSAPSQRPAVAGSLDLRL